MAVPISNVTRRVVYTASGTGPYAFTFEILANTDIAVYKDDTLLTFTTDYTVTIASNGTGSITLVTTPTGATQIAIVGNRTIQRTTDFVTGGDFFANTVNDEMDQQTIFAQQNAEGLQRALQAPQTDPTNINMVLPRKADRAGKYLAFDSNGNPEAGPTSADVDVVAGIADEVVTVAGIASNVTTVAGISSAVSTVSGNTSNVNTVAGISGNVTTVAGISSNVTTVAGISSNVSTVAGISSAVTGVAAISSAVSAVNSNSTNINAVNSNSTNINTCATNISAIIDAPNQATAAAASAASAAASAASGMYSAVQDKSANYTVVAGDAGDLIRVTTTSVAIAITLPAISTVSDGFKVAIVKWTGDGNAVTISRSASDTINGATSYVLGNQYSSATFVADSETAQWFAVASGLGVSNTVVDSFNGNGSTTAFTLSGDPGSENNTLVTISGVYQSKATYSVSGTTLTFSTAPPTGTANIEVVWTAPLAIGTPSDDTVSTAKLQALAVTSAKLASGAATGSKLGSDVVVTSGAQTVAGVKTFSNEPVFSAGLALASGQGINFSANSNAAGMTSETLNDYEEGTWTPTLKFGLGNTGITYSGQYGTYTKVGRVVTFTCYLLLSSKGSSTGAANINGLPFTSIGGNMFYNFPVRPQTVTGISGGCIAYLSANDNILYLGQTTTGTSGDVMDSNTANVSTFIVSGSYFTS